MGAATETKFGTKVA